MVKSKANNRPPAHAIQALKSKLKPSANSTTPTPDQQRQLSTLLTWLKENDIEYDTDLIKLTYSGTASGLGILAKKNCREIGRTVCRIPREAILSAKNCGVADIIEEAQLGGILAVTVALMFEWKQGARSPWYGYLQSLPLQEDLPVFWDPQDQHYLQGTCISFALPLQHAFLVHDFDTLVYPVLVQHSSMFPGVLDRQDYLELFFRATSLVMSRAFQVDSFHGDALVPLADAFNHKTGQEHVHMENDDVCIECGEVYCDCHEEEEGEEEHKHEHDNCHEDCHEEHAPVLKEEEEDEWQDEDEESDDELNEQDVIEMNLVKPLLKDKEVFNTFGELSNSCLFMRYGFIEEKNPFDVVHFSVEELVEFIRLHIQQGDWDEERVKNRIYLWKQLRHLVHRLEQTLQSTGEGKAEEEEEEEFDEEFDDEDDEDRPDPFAFTLDKDGIPDGDLITFLAIFHAPAKLLTRIYNDKQVAHQFILQVLCANGMQSVDKWIGSSSVFIIQNEPSTECCLAGHSKSSPMASHIATTLKLYAEYRLHAFKTHDGILEPSHRTRIAMALRQSEQAIWKAIQSRFDL